MNTSVCDARRLARLALIALILSAALVAPIRGMAAGDGNVSGTVTNLTTGTPAAGVTVTLSRFEGQTPVEDITTVADETGRYAFSGLDTSDGLVYVTSVTYDSVLYASGMLRLNEQAVQVADVSIYDTTTDQSAVAVSSRGVVLTAIDTDSGTVSCLDVFAFDFQSDRTLVQGDDGRTLRFPVPARASEVTPGTGFNFGSPSISGATVYATAPLYPGATTANLSWTAAYNGDALDLSVGNAYPTGSFRVLVPVDGDAFDDTIRVVGEGFQDGGVAAVGSANYHVWVAPDIAANQSVSFTFENLPEFEQQTNRLRTAEPLIIVILAISAATLLTAWVIRKRGLLNSRPVTLAPAVAAPLVQRRDALADQLRRVEADHTQGALDDSAYQHERHVILVELRAIARQLRGLGDDE